jgi:hypothetical protein
LKNFAGKYDRKNPCLRLKALKACSLPGIASSLFFVLFTGQTNRICHFKVFSMAGWLELEGDVRKTG